MLKLGCGAMALLSLLATAALLWTSAGITGALPSGMSGWVAAWFEAFLNPSVSVMLFVLCALLAAAAASVSELLLGLAFALLAAACSLLCLLGALGARYPGVAEWVTKTMGQ
jgi:hypothetical protein